MTKQTITVDLESWTPSPLNNIVSGGIHPGQMLVYTSGRQTGKSVYTKMLKNSIYGANLCNEILLPMKPVSKYKFSRAKWYTADLMTMNQDLFKVHEWCTEQFGPHDRYPNAWSRWVAGGIMGHIKFRDERDYVLFVLRWA